MAETCPGCGVAVIPGYMKCPKCQRPLKRRISTVAGGTAVEGSPLPIVPIIAGGVVALGIILFFALRGGDAKPKKPTDATGSDDAVETDDTPSQVATPGPFDQPDRDTNRRPSADPEGAARDLERTLKGQRLWATVEVSGSRVEVRSGSCRDANMIPAVESARTTLRSAGLTQVRCVENSGAVVFEREL